MVEQTQAAPDLPNRLPYHLPPHRISGREAPARSRLPAEALSPWCSNNKAHCLQVIYLIERCPQMPPSSGWDTGSFSLMLPWRGTELPVVCFVIV